MEDKRITQKTEKFIETFQGIPLYFVVEEIYDESISKPRYELLFVTTQEADYQVIVDGVYEDSNEVFHLFKSSILGQTFEWVESYNGHTKMCDVSLDLDEASLAILAHLSLEKDKTVNDILVDAIKEYANKSE